MQRLGEQHLNTFLTSTSLQNPQVGALGHEAQLQQHCCNHTSSSVPRLSSSNSFSQKWRMSQNIAPSNVHHHNCQAHQHVQQNHPTKDRIPSHRAAFQPRKHTTDYQSHQAIDDVAMVQQVHQQQQHCHACGDRSTPRIPGSSHGVNPGSENQHMWYPTESATTQAAAGDSVTSGICSMSSDEGVVSLRKHSGAQNVTSKSVPIVSSSSCNSAFTNHTGTDSQQHYQPFHVRTS